ncbi:LacI family DNA-binding transcriptional regulator [Winogradskyella sp. MIT101101]|uniref:LacI family DNA-binding transcriptional regulator n=1 Tax=Winogradskyella sp. MIT101101 TaxID=3098297 RepID=UPI00399B6DC2
MPRNITLKNLAELLSVSISTVSKALNDSPEISERTKQKVLEAAKRYNYKPNYIAQSLKNNTTKTIGVVIPDILNYFFVKALVGIEQEARKHGYKVVTCISNESYNTEVENVNTLANGSVDGFLISLSNETQQKKDYSHINDIIINNKIPLVLFDRVTDKVQCDQIVSDNYDSAFSATECLIRLGCKNIALFITKLNLSVINERMGGCLAALKKHNLYRKDLVVNICNTAESELEIKEFLKEKKVDAIFSLDEVLAVKVTKVAKQMCINIPKSLKIIGFADGELSKEYYPSISAIDLHAKEIGSAAVKQLISRLTKPYVPSNITITIPSKLVHRNSTTSVK